jgi:hypothetical protein
LREAFAVFEGIVESREPHAEKGRAESGEEYAYHGWRITLRTQRVYKGPNHATIVVHTGSGGGDCGYPLQPNQRYLVYAYGESADDLGIGICSRTAPLENAGADLRFLRGEPPTEEDLLTPSERRRMEENPGLKNSGATICGRVRRADNQPLAERSVAFLWPATRSGGPDRQNRVYRMLDAEGSFRFRMLEPGAYYLGASEYVPRDEANPYRYQALYPGTQSFGSAGRIDLQPRSSRCPVELVLEAVPLHTLAIRVNLATGGRLPEGISLTIQSMDETPFPVNADGFPDEDGIVRFKNIPAGRYLIQFDSYSEDARRVEAANFEIDVPAGGSEEAVTLYPRRVGGKKPN